MIRSAIDKRLLQERTIRLQRQNAKLSIELARLRGELIPLETIKADVITCNLAVKALLLGLPARLTPQLFAAGSQGEVFALLHDAIYEALLSLSGEGEEPEEGEAVP